MLQPCSDAGCSQEDLSGAMDDRDRWQEKERGNPCYYVKEPGLVWFYGISTIVGYLRPNPPYTYILNIYDLVGLDFMAYQPL